MLEPVFQFIEKFVTDFSWTRIAIFFSFISLIAASFMLYEWQTATNELSRYERSVQILKDIDILVSSKNEEVSNSAKLINERMRGVIEKDDITSKLEISTSPELAQVFFAILPWILIALILVPAAAKNDNNPSNMAVGFLIFILFVSVLAYFIPTDWSKLARYGGMQLLNILFFLILSYIGNKKNL